MSLGVATMYVGGYVVAQCVADIQVQPYNATAPDRLPLSSWNVDRFDHYQFVGPRGPSFRRCKVAATRRAPCPCGGRSCTFCLPF